MSLNPSSTISKIIHNPKKVYLITCPTCSVTFSSYYLFSSHNSSCLQQEIHTENIINSSSEFDEFLQDIEISFKINFNKITMRNNVLIFHCNFKSESKFSCPFFLMRTQYDSGKIFIKNKYLGHNHSIDFNNLRLVRREKNKLKAMISEGKGKKEILSVVNESFDSPKAQFIGKEYISNVVSKEANEKISSNAMETCISVYNSGKKQDRIVEHFIKLAGENNEDLDYPESDLLICFSFRSQIEYLENNEVKYLMGDTTYSTNRQGMLLVSFTVLGQDERPFPILYILTTSDKSDILIKCLEAFKENIVKFNKFNFFIFMSDMANNFHKALSTVFSHLYNHLWCSFHFYKAFTINRIKIIKDLELSNFVKSEFCRLNRILVVEDFNKDLNKFCIILKNKNFSFYKYFYRVFVLHSEKWCMPMRYLSRLNTNCFQEAGFKSLKERFLDNKKNNRLETLILGLEQYTNESFGLVEKARILKNQEFIGYRMKKMNVEHKKAIKTMIEDNNIVTILNENQFKINDNIVTRLPENMYAIKMACLGCESELNLFFCDCYKYTTEKIYCYHIHIVALSEKEKYGPSLNILNDTDSEIKELNNKIIKLDRSQLKTNKNSLDMLLSKFNSLRTKLEETPHSDIITKCCDFIDTMTSLVDLKNKNEFIMDFDKSKQQRNNSKTQRKDFLPFPFTKKKK